MTIKVITYYIFIIQTHEHLAKQIVMDWAEILRGLVKIGWLTLA